MRGLVSAIVAAIFTFPLTVSAQAPAQSEPTERATGLFRQLVSEPTVVTMVEGPAPTARPAKPIEARFWNFFRKVDDNDGKPMDAAAVRRRVNCAAGSVEELGWEWYRNGVRVESLERRIPEHVISPNSPDFVQIRAVCDPAFKAQAVYANHAAARAAVPLPPGSGAVVAKTPALPTAPAKGADSTGPGRGQDAGALPRSPLRVAASSREEGVVVMVSGPAPATRPNAPFRVLTWHFYRDEKKTGKIVYDTLAETRIADCAANTMRITLYTAYREGRLVRALPPPAGTDAGGIKPGTIAHARLRAVCEPGYRANEPSYPDHIAARAAALKFFTRTEAGPARTSANSAPTPVTAGEKAAAARSAPPSAKAPQPAPVAQPKGGYAAVLPGPLRVYVAAPGTVQAIVGAKPQQRPSKPFEKWIWIFDPGIKGAGNERFDSIAVRYRIDCAGGTLQPLLTETYLGEVARIPVKSSAAPSAPKPKTAGHDLLRAACDPQFNPKAPTFPDRKAARAAAMKYFASQKK